jgi:hypothetical protein
MLSSDIKKIKFKAATAKMILAAMVPGAMSLGRITFSCRRSLPLD